MRWLWLVFICLTVEVCGGQTVEVGGEKFDEQAEALRNKATRSDLSDIRVPLMPGSFFTGNTVNEGLLKKAPPKVIERIRNIDKQLDQDAINLHAEVISVASNGILAKATFWSKGKHGGEPDREFKNPVFIYGRFEILVDGSVWEGKVWSAQRYQYQAADNGLRTVLGFLPTKQAFLQVFPSFAASQ